MWLRAERQTGGRGRLGRRWVSSPANLHTSTLVRLRAADPPAATLALLAGVALHQLTAAYAKDAGLILKWPNDLLAGEAKLSGILLERSGDAVVIGFGVNLAEHPQDLERPAASLRALAGTAPDPSEFLVELADAFADWLSRWRSEGFGPVRARWLESAHPVGTALATRLADDTPVQGLFDGLDEAGALRLRLADGTTRTIHAGDVFLV